MEVVDVLAVLVVSSMLHHRTSCKILLTNIFNYSWPYCHTWQRRGVRSKITTELHQFTALTKFHFTSTYFCPFLRQLRKFSVECQRCNTVNFSVVVVGFETVSVELARSGDYMSFTSLNFHSTNLTPYLLLFRELFIDFTVCLRFWNDEKKLYARTFIWILRNLVTQSLIRNLVPYNGCDVYWYLGIWCDGKLPEKMLIAEKNILSNDDDERIELDLLSAIAIADEVHNEVIVRSWLTDPDQNAKLERVTKV